MVPGRLTHGGPSPRPGQAQKVEETHKMNPRIDETAAEPPTVGRSRRCPTGDDSDELAASGLDCANGHRWGGLSRVDGPPAVLGLDELDLDAGPPCSGTRNPVRNERVFHPLQSAPGDEPLRTVSWCFQARPPRVSGPHFRVRLRGALPPTPLRTGFRSSSTRQTRTRRCRNAQRVAPSSNGQARRDPRHHSARLRE